MSNLFDVYSAVLDRVSKLYDLEENAQTLRQQISQLEQEEAKIRNKKFGTGTIGCIFLLLMLAVGFMCAGFVGSIVVFIAYLITAFLIDALFFEKRRNHRADSLHSSHIIPARVQLGEYEKELRKCMKPKSFVSLSPTFLRSVSLWMHFNSFWMLSNMEKRKQKKNFLFCGLTNPIVSK